MARKPDDRQMDLFLEATVGSMRRNPEWVRRNDEHELWELTVRDPAEAASEGRRRVAVGRDEVAYEVAPLPDGRWAVGWTMTCGCSGQCAPWQVFHTRQAAVAAFLEAARRFLANEHNSLSTPGQIKRAAKLCRAINRRQANGVWQEPEAEPGLCCHGLTYGSGTAVP